MGRRVGGFVRCWRIVRGEGEEREVRKVSLYLCMNIR